MLRSADRILQGLFLVVLTATVLLAESGTHFTATSASVSGAGEAIKITVNDWSSDSIRDGFVAAWTLTASATAPPGRGGRGGGSGAGNGGGGGAGRGAGRGARGGADVTANAPAPASTPAPQAVAPALPADPDQVDSPAPAQRGGRGGRGGGSAGGGAATQTPESSLAAAIQKAPTAGILWTSENVGYSIKYAYRLSQPDGGERIILATDRRVGKWSNLWQPAATVTPTDYSFSIIELRLNSRGEGEGRGVVTGKVAVDSAAKTIALDNYAALPVILKSVKRQSGN
jgi:hypothetical protein